jgi:hypothetical protein
LKLQRPAVVVHDEKRREQFGVGPRGTVGAIANGVNRLDTSSRDQSAALRSRSQSAELPQTLASPKYSTVILAPRPPMRAICRNSAANMRVISSASQRRVIARGGSASSSGIALKMLASTWSDT